VPISAVTANSVVDCTTPAGNWATRFNHDLYKGDGCRGDALLPSANVVLAEAGSVEYVIWSAIVNGITMPAAITIAGIKERAAARDPVLFRSIDLRDNLS
jgi:hypothetical protein